MTALPTLATEDTIRVKGRMRSGRSTDQVFVGGVAVEITAEEFSSYVSLASER